MMEQMLNIADKLSEEIKNMQKCLQCTICLHTITDPIKTLCGHRFCRACIQMVLQNKNALCPLCNCGIQRRSISKDEHMILYIDRLQKLIEAIQLDSGIDILLHSSRPRSTRECKLSDNTELRRSDVEELTRPSCSYLDNSLRVSEPARRKRPPAKGRAQMNKAKATQKGGNTIRRYLSKSDLSGTGQSKKSKDFLREESAEAKVHKWLGNLGNNDELDEPEKVEVAQPTECDLDDTLAISVSQNDAQNQDECMDVTTKNDVRRPCSRNTNNEREPTDKRGRRWSTEMRNTTDNQPSAMNFSLDDSRPSTSGAMRSLDDSKERNMDVHRASTCEMLSNMQKNWSTVAKFGKEMRTRKKKLMSLNVSIESKKKSRRTEMNLNVSEKVAEDRDERQRRRGNATNEESVNGKESLIKGDFVRGGEASPRDRKERSISKEVPLAGESFVIQLQEGRVPVQSLKSCQINAIIGVNVETDESSNREEMAFPAGGRVDPFDTPFRDRDKIFSQMSLPASEQTEPDLIDKPINKRNCCPTPTIETIDVSSSATNYQTSTPRRNRLSLNRRSAGDSSRSNVDSSIALQSVRRDLNRQLEIEDDVDKRSSEGVIITEKHRGRPINDKPSGRRDGVLAGSSNEKNNTSSITFTKLGKTFRHCRRRIRFLYLGTTRQEAILSRYPGFHPQKPCNPVDMVDSSEDFAIESYLENNDRATVSDTQPMDEEPESIAEGNNSSKMKGPVGVFENQVDVGEENSSREVAEEIVPAEQPVVSNNSEDIDILYVSLNESRVSDSPSAEQPAKSSNAPTKDTARMMSPVRDTMRSLSLESPTAIDTLQTQRIIHEPGEPNKEKNRASSSRGLSCTSDTSDSSYVLRRRSKKSNIREKLCNRMKRKLEGKEEKEEEDEQDDRSSDHSFSSQATCIRNSDKEDLPLVKGSSLGEKSELSNPSTKDIDVVSLSSDPDIAPSDKKKEKKVYKRILSFESSDGDSMNTGCASNKAAAGCKSLASDCAPTKRKRAVSPDSVNEDLCAIVNSWLEVDDRYRKKGKLDGQSRDSSDSRNACRRKSEDNTSAKAGSSSYQRDKATDKLSTALQRRQHSDFTVDECNNRERSCSFRRTELRRKSLEVREAPKVTDQDSPDFGATIDEVKILLNRLPDLMQEDNFDDVIANVNTDTLVNECNDESRKKEILSGRESIEYLEAGSCEWKSKPARSSYVKNPRSSSERVPRVDSNGSDKENKSKMSLDIVYGSDDENEETTVKVYVNSAKESSRDDKSPEETKSNDWISCKSPARFQSNPTTPPGDKSGALSNSIVKDTYDQDSLMNITQQYLMIKQFEEDLFGKPDSSKRGPQTPTGSKKCCNAKDVEHSAEEDDIVENTPSTKTKILEAISSTQRSSNSRIMRKQQSGVETPRSRNGKSPSNFSTPGSKTNIPPLCQSTPKTCHTNSMTFIPRASQSLNKEARKNSASQSVQKTAVQSVQRNTVQSVRMNVVQGVRMNAVQGVQVNAVQTVPSNSRRSYCFVSSGLESGEVDQLKKLARTLPQAVYHTQFNVNVTHVVVKTNNNNGASKTLKYLQGIVHRKWIVNYQWVIDSLKEGTAVNEEFYEVVDCRTLEAGPRKSRLREKGLFEGFVFHCIGPYVNVSVEQYEDLLRATGAIVVDSLYALTAQASKLKIILIQDDIYEFKIIEWYKKARAIAIVHEWVVECISQYKLISLYPYLQELSRQDVLALGYPEYLVEEETGWESDSTYDV